MNNFLAPLAELALRHSSPRAGPQSKKNSSNARRGRSGEAAGVSYQLKFFRSYGHVCRI